MAGENEGTRNAASSSADAAQPGPARLILLNTPLSGTQFPLGEHSASIGRGPENDICLDHSSISRVHARLERTRGGYLVRDAGSRNGIRLNGRQVTAVSLRPGDVVEVGDVLLRFEVSTHEPNPLSAAASQDNQVMVLNEPVAQSHASRKDSGGVRKAVLVAVVGVTTFVLVVVGWLVYSAVISSGVRTLTLPPSLLRVNENRLVRVGAQEKIGDRRQFTEVDFKPSPIGVEDPSVVRATRYEKGYLLLTGLAGGASDVTLQTPFGNIIRIRVIVRGRAPDPMEGYALLPASDAERRDMAAGFVEAADRLAKSQPFNALKQYRIAAALLEPTNLKGRMYVRAVDGINEMDSVLQEKYEELRSGVAKAAAARDLDGAMVCLQSIMELIPDPNDPRHQKAGMARADVIAGMEQSKRNR